MTGSAPNGTQNIAGYGDAAAPDRRVEALGSRRPAIPKLAPERSPSSQAQDAPYRRLRAVSVRSGLGPKERLDERSADSRNSSIGEAGQAASLL